MFLSLFTEMGLNERNLEIIFEEGYDSWESLLKLNEKKLNDMKIENKVEKS